MFQDDLLQVLDDFAVGTAAAFYELPASKKAHFIRRLYKAFVDSEEQALSDLSAAGGVKLHFAISGDLASPNSNVPSAAFLKKLCFYANRTLISFPFKELTETNPQRVERGAAPKNWRAIDRPVLFGNIRSGRSGKVGWVSMKDGEGYRVDPAAFEDFLEVVSSLRPAINAGLTYILPVFPDK